MIELKDPVSIQDFDSYLGIAAFVDSKLKPVRAAKMPMMFDLLQVLPDKSDHKYYEKGQLPRIIPTARQIQIYDFVTSAMLIADPEDRLLIYTRNFPRRKSYRELKKHGWLHWSHTTIAHKYKLALFALCTEINKFGIKKFI